MCGIIGYVGGRASKPLLIKGLERLEYRGYDSAGIALLEADGLDYVRAVGNLANLKEAAGPNGSVSTTGLGHTRWATHGGVTEQNAHPLTACDDTALAIVLNGIVENYRELREELVERGHTFRSETDAEVVAHLLEDAYDGDLVAAVRAAYARLEGHFTFVLIHKDHPGELVGVRHQTPMVIGLGDGENFLASNLAAFLSETRRVQFPGDGDIVHITPDAVEIVSAASGEPVQLDSVEVDWDDDAAERSGYETFMLKEIYEQPDGVAETIGDRVRHGSLVLEGLGMSEPELKDLRRIVIVGCGTAYHAGVVGRYAIEEWARVPVEPDVASEWIYRNPVVDPGTLVIGISQSGETRDTIQAMQLAREKGARTVAITNMMGSQITREVDSVLYTRTGLEVGVAASKTFTAQIALLFLIGLKLSQCRSTLPKDEVEFILDEVYDLPQKMQRAALLRAAVLPLSRPPHRSAGRARGRAEAEGDLVHPDGGLLRRRDEARPDRAARGGDAGRRRRDAHPRLRQDRLEHPGDACTRRACDRDRDRRQRGHPAPRRRRDLRAEVARVPAGGARDAAAAAAGLPHRAPARAERRPAAQPREDRHGRVTVSMNARVAGDK
jgi:glucosamine--fructose-6-phosphate aminotransferase (isomerizing)